MVFVATVCALVLINKTIGFLVLLDDAAIGRRWRGIEWSKTRPGTDLQRRIVFIGWRASALTQRLHCHWRMPMKMDGSASVAPISLVSSEKSSRGAMALSVEYCVVCGDRASGKLFFTQPMHSQSPKKVTWTSGFYIRRLSFILSCFILEPN